MDPYLDRGHRLLTLERYEEAEVELKKALADNPHNPFTMAFISVCYLETDRRKEALEFAKRAVGIDANNPFLFYSLARCYFYNKDIDNANTAIDQGLQLDPNDAHFYLLRAQILYYQEEWELALKQVENGLAVDAEDVNLINLRAQCLVNLNRQTEAAQTLDYALQKAPENTFSHSNKGWIAIEQDEYEKAISFFKEALRLDPTNDYAKTGLKEAIKAKNFLYRYILKYFLWMNKMQQKGRWAFVIGLFVLYQVLIVIANNSPTWASILSPFIILYIILAFSSWIAMPISNLFLRFHPMGKYALEEDEILGSNVVGGLAGSALLSLVIFYLSGHSFYIAEGTFFVSDGGEFLFNLVLVCSLLLIPIGGLFLSRPKTEGRRKLTFFVLALVGLGLLAVFTPYSWAFNALAFGIFIFSFSANSIIAKGAREF